MTFSEFRKHSVDEQLQLILKHFYKESQVPSRRHIPIFVGTLKQSRDNLGWYYVSDIQLLGAYPIKSYPFPLSDLTVPSYTLSEYPFLATQPSAYLDSHPAKMGLNGEKVIFTLKINPDIKSGHRFLVVRNWELYELEVNPHGVLSTAYNRYQTICSDLSENEQDLVKTYLHQDSSKELNDRLDLIAELKKQESDYQKDVAKKGALESDIKSLEAKKKEWEDKVEPLRTEHSNLTDQVTNANKALAALQQQSLKLSRENRDLEQTKHSLEEDIKKAENAFATATKNAQNAKVELNNFERKASSLRQQIAFYTSGINLDRVDASSAKRINEPQDENWIKNVFNQRFDYYYDDDLLKTFLSALNTNQIITLFGKPGTGKTTFVSQIASALGAKYSIIPVQNNWTDSADILGYYNPIDHTYQSTPFLDAILDAYAEWTTSPDASRLHIICLDEMNLARVEYYFATFLSLLQLPEDKRVIKLLPRSLNEGIDSVFQKEKANEKLSAEEEKLSAIRRYHDFLLPPNIHFVGTINNDDTTNPLSPKVIDRSIFIEIKSTKNPAPAGWQGRQKGQDIPGYYPISQFTIANGDEDIPKLFANENFRLKNYIQGMWSMFQRLGPTSTKEFADIIISTKILPRVTSIESFSATDYCNKKEYPKAYNAFSDHIINKNIDAYNHLGG